MTLSSGRLGRSKADRCKVPTDDDVLIATTTSRWLTAVACLLLLTSPPLPARPDTPPKSVVFSRREALGVGVNLLTVDLNDPTVKVTVELAAGFPGHDEPFVTMAKRSGAVAAVTGTFFSTTSLYPIGDIAIDGRLRYFGGMGSVLALTSDNEVMVRRVGYGRHQDWSDFETVLAAGPMLVRNGQVDLFPSLEHFTDPRVLGRAPRAAVGWTRENKLLLTVLRQDITLHELAKVLQRLGCVHAINLDGGSSAGLYYNGAVKVAPSRRLVNIVAIHAGVPKSLRFIPAGTGPGYALHGQKRLEFAATAYGRGDSAFLRHNWEKAIQHFRTAARLSPDNASYHLALADALNAVGRQAERATVLADAGRAYMVKSQIRLAAVQFRRALHLNPVDIPTRRLYVQALRAEGDMQGADDQRRSIDWMELALTTPLSQANSTRRLEQAVLSPPSPNYRRAAPPLRGKVVHSRSFLGKRKTFQPSRWDFRVQLRGDWEFRLNRENTVLYLENRRQHFTGVLRVFPASPSASVEEFGKKYHAGLFHVCESSRRFQRNGAQGIEDRCSALVAGDPMVTRCVFVQKDSYILALTLSAKKALRGEADKQFDSIVRGLGFGS